MTEVKKGAQLWKQYYWWLVGAGQTSKRHCLLNCWKFQEIKKTKMDLVNLSWVGHDLYLEGIVHPNMKNSFIYPHDDIPNPDDFFFDHKKAAGSLQWMGLRLSSLLHLLKLMSLWKKSMYQVWNGMKMIINDRIIIEGELSL